jgi:hypothetical protein
MSIAECGLKKKTPKSEIGNSKSEMGGPMLFAQKVLAPRGRVLSTGPQPNHAGNVNPRQADPRQSRGFT